MQFTTTLVAATLALASSASAFRLTVWDYNGYSGASRAYTTVGVKTFPFYANSYKWESPDGDGCCVKFCSGSREVGYRCPAYNQPQSTSSFNKVVLGCGSDVLNC